MTQPTQGVNSGAPWEAKVGGIAGRFVSVTKSIFQAQPLWMIEAIWCEST